MLIVSKEKFKKKAGTIQIAEEDDPTPTWTSLPKNIRDRIKHGSNWLQAHYGKLYAKRVVFNIEPKDWAICILHMNLRLVGLLVRELLLDKVGDFADEATYEKLYHLMRAKGIYLTRRRVERTKNFDTWHASIAKHSFHGADCAIMLAIWPQCLEIIHPEHKRAVDAAAEVQYRASFEIFEHYSKIMWHLVNDHVAPRQRSADGSSDQGAFGSSRSHHLRQALPRGEPPDTDGLHPSAAGSSPGADC
jgi:hypothetical protein